MKRARRPPAGRGRSPHGATPDAANGAGTSWQALRSRATRAPTALGASRSIPACQAQGRPTMSRRFGFELVPIARSSARLGSKEGLAKLASGITSAGRIVLGPTQRPSHPYGFIIIAFGSLRHIPVRQQPRSRDLSFRRSNARCATRCREGADRPVPDLTRRIPLLQVVDLEFLCRDRRFPANDKPHLILATSPMPISISTSPRRRLLAGPGRATRRRVPPR